jgi:hypothetical protein
MSSAGKGAAPPAKQWLARPNRVAIFLFLLWLLLPVSAAWARPTTEAQARQVVQRWLSLDPKPLGATLGGEVKEVQAFPDSSGNAAYYVVYLNPAGMVLVPADDLVEPIIGFLPEGHYDPSPSNPLGALVRNDIPGRVARARQVEARVLKGAEPLSPKAPQAVAQRKWGWLSNPTTGGQALSAEAGITGPLSDERVAPFIQSKWDQCTINDNLPDAPACYNYYTPLFGAGNRGNYPCGCLATAMAQVMRYWQYPELPVVATFDITADSIPETGTIRGGNGAGGPYDWGNMELDPKEAFFLNRMNSTKCQAIGALTYDAGVSVNSDYENGETGADGLSASQALIKTFHYSNAINGFSNTQLIPDPVRAAMINTNLDTQFPVILRIAYYSGEGQEGHFVVGDGYGYNAATMYHHLNMGWSGLDDAWYHLPGVDTGDNGNYTLQNLITYNIYSTGSGEIISGRVTDTQGKPLSGAAMTARYIVQSGVWGIIKYKNATTDANGIYALPQVPSETPYTVSVSKFGYKFTSQNVATGTSINSTDHYYTLTCGNVWGVNFTGSPIIVTPIYPLLLQ